ncbi:MAG: hypothetical protein ACJA1C_001140 [Crocinitomicaceae bacterium]|jgi:hypothetical protein
MKKTLLLVALLVINTLSSFAQSNSDDPFYNNSTPSTAPVSALQSGLSNAKTDTIAGMIINGEILDCDSTNTELMVSNGSCAYQWYSDSLGVNTLGSASTLPLTGITGDTTLYISEAVADTAIGLPLPPHGSTFNGNVRGYWFQASSDFIITGATVPTDASTGTSNIAVLKFDSIPPLWSVTTNDFTVLGLWQNEVADTVFFCAAVDSGDYIGVLGNRADANSYAAQFTSSINGLPVDLSRLGMQLPLSSNTPQDVFSEASGSISRVELIYGNANGFGPIYPVSVTAPQSSSQSTTMSICNGDSVLLEGAMQSTAGLYIDTLASMNGCDSIVSTTLSIEQPSSSNQTVDLCQGDSLLINGVYETLSATYTDSLQTINGCDSLVTMVVDFFIVDPSATQAGVLLTATNASATYQWVDCDNGNAPIAGATSQSYTATANGNYAVLVTSNSCTEMSPCFSVTSVGIDEYDLGTAFSIYPNPTSDVVTYSFNGNSSMEFILTNIAGELIWKGNSSGNEGTIDLSAYATGTYLLDVTNGDKRATIRLIKK